MPKVETTKPTYNFKNIWRNYFNYSPKFATKGILHSVDRNANIALNKKVDSIVKPILKNEGFKVIHLGEDLSRFYTPVNKQKSKESLEIPYINKYYKQRCKEIQKDIEEYGEEDVWDTNITEIGIDTVTCIGKYKGIGDSSTLYYFVLVIGGHNAEDLENTTVAVEVITPLDKGEEFFLNEVKKAVSKLNIWKFTGKKISVNKCPKSVTGSAESKVFAYHGQVITASSKEEAITKIIASDYNKKHLENFSKLIKDKNVGITIDDYDSSYDIKIFATADEKTEDIKDDDIKIKIKKLLPTYLSNLKIKIDSELGHVSAEIRFNWDTFDEHREGNEVSEKKVAKDINKIIEILKNGITFKNTNKGFTDISLVLNTHHL